MSQAASVNTGGGGGGSVNSVSGTANRITISGTATDPIVDIAATYVGQASITTLGTITTGVWNGTVIGSTFGGTAQSSWATGDILYASGVNTLAKLTAASNGQVLTLAAGIPSWATPTTGTVTSVSGTANRITSTGGSTPVLDISASYVGQASITTLGTITTGVWNGTTIAVANGGTSLTTLTAHALYVGNGTSAPNAVSVGVNGSLLQGVTGSDPVFTTSPTIAGTLTTQGARVIPRTATATSYTVLTTDYLIAVTDTSAVRTITFPNAPTTGQVFTVKDESLASSVNNIKITSVSGTVLFDGLTSQYIISNGGSITFYFNGTAYYSM